MIMGRGFANVGLVWTLEEFRKYLAGMPAVMWGDGKPDSVCLHHTWQPSLANRPGGLNRQHVRNLQHFYQVDKGWSAGPHLFVDDSQRCVMGLTPLDLKGVHAVSFNRRSIAIEVLGDFDRESPVTGRGLECWRNAAAAAAALFAWLKISPTAKTLLFHRDDPMTGKTCPGNLVGKEWVLELVREG